MRHKGKSSGGVISLLILKKRRGRVKKRPFPCGEKGTLLHCWWECKLVQPLWKTVWRFLRKLKKELPCDPAISLLGICPEKSLIRKDTCIPMFIAALFTIVKTWNNLNVHQDEWIEKIWYIYTIEYYLAIKKNEIMPFAATRVDLEIIS